MAAVSEVTERMTVLVREEIELAKVEAITKAKSLAVGAALGALAGVFGLFALIYALQAAAWAISDAIGYDWVGFLVVFAALAVLGGLAVLIAVRKFRVGAPAPKMAIEEAKLIRETVTAKTEVSG